MVRIWYGVVYIRVYGIVQLEGVWYGIMYGMVCSMVYGIV